MDLAVTDPDCYSLIKFLRNLVVDLLDSSRNDTSLLEVIGQTKHCECFTGSCLTVSHDSAIVASNDSLDVSNVSNGDWVGPDSTLSVIWVVVTSGGSASVAEVTPGVHVEAMLTWLKAGELSLNDDLLSLSLGKTDSSGLELAGGVSGLWLWSDIVRSSVVSISGRGVLNWLFPSGA